MFKNIDTDISTIRNIHVVDSVGQIILFNMIIVMFGKRFHYRVEKVTFGAENLHRIRIRRGSVENHIRIVGR